MSCEDEEDAVFVLGEDIEEHGLDVHLVDLKIKESSEGEGAQIEANLQTGAKVSE